MPSLRSLAAGALLLASTVNAHFVLVSPPSLEGTTINEDKEDDAPCGANLPDLSKKGGYDFHVDGDFVALQSGHPQVKWLIRGTLQDKASGNWSQLFPIVQQSGLGNFCETTVTAPKEWVGKTGVIGIAANAPDGLLYQCAVVNFVVGSNTSPGSSCNNGSSVTADFVSDATLTGLLGNPTTTPSGTTAPTSSAKPSGNAAPTLASTFGLPVGSLLITFAMVLAGAGLL